MDPKQQAELFYHSLAATDAASCQLLARAARFQRGRVAAIGRKLEQMQDNNAPEKDLEPLKAEASRRGELAKAFDTLDATITKAIAQRAVLDQDKFK